jgi:hypothetical protein
MQSLLSEAGVWYPPHFLSLIPLSDRGKILHKLYTIAHYLNYPLIKRYLPLGIIMIS